jgi:anti-sigma B factor antagonist
VRYEVVELGPTANKFILAGRLDSASVGRVETPFTAALAAGDRHAVLDLRQLDFLSSLGIRLLLSVARAVAKRGGKMVLFGAQTMVAEVLTAMSLDEVLPMVATEEAALARLAG